MQGSVSIYYIDYNDNSNKVLYSIIENTNAIPAPMKIPYSDIFITYTTTNKATGLGFMLTYYGIESVESFAGNDVVYLNSASMFSMLTLNTVPSSSSSQSLSSLSSASSSLLASQPVWSSLSTSTNVNIEYRDVVKPVKIFNFINLTWIIITCHPLRPP
jgi:hypothetical protein